MTDEAKLGAGAELRAAIARLAQTIDARSGADPGISYTAKLLARGPLQAAKKAGEEGVEFALAVAAGDEAEITAEAADVVYHMLVALKTRGVSLDAVGAALAEREGRSGIEEKARRPKD